MSSTYRAGGTCPLCGAEIEVQFPYHLENRCTGADEIVGDGAGG